jgi:ribose transport system substrate-binding protein
MHTTGSDWAKQQLAGISATLERYDARLLDVIDCEFSADRQVRAIESLLANPPDGVISIPVDNVATAPTYAQLGPAGIRLVLMDNAPAGLMPGRDYATVVSADNFGNGQVAAMILSMFIHDGGRVAMIGYGRDFFSINERELGFRKMLGDARPDIELVRAEFGEVEEAGEVVLSLFHNGAAPDGIFVVWDDPAMKVATALRLAGVAAPMTTIDLGNEVALEIASGGLVVGAGAQRPYDQGGAEALATIMALCGEEPPPWVALPALSVIRRNVLDAYQRVWHVAPSAELRAATRSKSQYSF